MYHMNYWIVSNNLLVFSPTLNNVSKIDKFGIKLLENNWGYWIGEYVWPVPVEVNSSVIVAFASDGEI